MMSERRLSIDNLEYALRKCQIVLQVDLDRLPNHIENLESLLQHFHTSLHQQDESQLIEIRKELTHTAKTIEQLLSKFSELKRLRNRVECKQDQSRLDYNIDLSAIRKSGLNSLNNLSDIVQHNLSLIYKSNSPRQERFKEVTLNCWRKIENDLEHMKMVLDDIDTSSRESSPSHQQCQSTLNSKQSDAQHSPSSSPWKSRMQHAALPIAGAAIGAVMAGPVGFLVGAKVGAAVGLLGGGVVGLTGGGIVSKVHDRLQSQKRLTTEKVELTPLVSNSNTTAGDVASNSSTAAVVTELSPVSEAPYGTLVLTESLDNTERAV